MNKRRVTKNVTQILFRVLRRKANSKCNRNFWPNGGTVVVREYQLVIWITAAVKILQLLRSAVCVCVCVCVCVQLVGGSGKCAMNCKCMCWTRALPLTGTLRLANNWKDEGHPNNFPPLTSCHTENAPHPYYKATSLVLFIAIYPRKCSLRHCAPSRKVVGSIPDVIIGIFR